jgi:lysozyme
MKITHEKATELLKDRIRDDKEFLDQSVFVPLNVNQEVALLSFIYNLGQGNFQSSTLRMKLNRGEYQNAADEFLRWNKARVDGILTPLKGLTNRRIAERSLFLQTRTNY